MKKWNTVGKAKGVGGAELVLQERDGEYALRFAGIVLMSSARHSSEEAMADAGLSGLGLPAPRVLIGGLGFGYTLRAVLDRLPVTGRAAVAEISSAVVEWNRTVLAPLAGSPLSDPRVEVLEGDVADIVKRSTARFDAILLDVDNGPNALPTTANARLYTPKGLGWCREALSRRGRLVIWSAGTDDRFVGALKDAGFKGEQRSVPVRPGTSARHVLFVAERAR